MARLVRNAALLCIAGILVASAALAQPSPVLSNVGNGQLTVEGSTTPAGVNPDACADGRCGDLTVTVVDIFGAAMPGVAVVVDFAGCPDINISCDQLTPTTGQTYVPPHTVSGTTNAAGQFTFRVQGAGPTNTATCGAANCAGTNAGAACATVTVFAPGFAPVLIGALRVAAYDVDRAGSPATAVSFAVDVPKVFAERLNIVFGATARARDDYDFDGDVDIVDVAREAQAALDRGLGTGSSDTQHTGWSTWATAGTPAGFCP